MLSCAGRSYLVCHLPSRTDIHNYSMDICQHLTYSPHSYVQSQSGTHQRLAVRCAANVTVQGETQRALCLEVMAMGKDGERDCLVCHCNWHTAIPLERECAGSVSFAGHTPFVGMICRFATEDGHNGWQLFCCVATP